LEGLVEKKTVYKIAGGSIAGAALLIGIAAYTFGRTATVTGRVTLLGRPLVWGSVILTGSDGRSVAARIEPDGSFTVPNAPTGDVIVAVTSPDPLVDHYKRQIKSARVVLPKSQWPAPPVDRNLWFVIPKKYESPKTSDLKVTVGRGTNPCELTLVP
jgi:hypothetical protein